MKREHDKQNINENIDHDEQLWLSAVERLHAEKDPEVSVALRARIKQAIDQERHTVRRKIIRWPAIAASVAAAALVVWLVVPGLFTQTTRAPFGEMAAPQDASVMQTTDSEAFLPESEPSVDGAKEEAQPVEPFQLPPQAAPEIVETPAVTNASGKTNEAAIRPIEMDAPADIDANEDFFTREIDEEEIDKYALYLGGDESYVLRRIAESELKGLDRLGTRVYRDTPFGRQMVERFMLELEDPLEKADARRFIDEAFDDGFAVLIEKLGGE